MRSCRIAHSVVAVAAVLAAMMFGVGGHAMAQQGELIADGPFLLSGAKASESLTFQYPGLPSASCEESVATGGEIGKTPAAPLESQDTEFTLMPGYQECVVGIFPATLQFGECDLAIGLGETTEEAGTYEVSAGIACASGEEEAHWLVYSDKAHTNQICDIRFGEQAAASELHATSVSEGGVTVNGVMTIHASKSNPGCGGEGTTTEATLQIDMELSGVNEEEESTEVDIVHDAPGMLTSDGPFYLSGTDEASGNAFSYPGLPDVKCPESHYLASAEGGLEAIASGSESFTLLPSYTGCKGSIFPTTLALNGCHYVVDMGPPVESGSETFTAISEIVCPEGKSAHITLHSDEAHENPICTVVIGPQSGLEGLHVKDLGEGELLVSGTAEGVKASRSGSACSTGSTEEAELEANFKLSGVDEEGEPTTVLIS